MLAVEIVSENEFVFFQKSTLYDGKKHGTNHLYDISLFMSLLKPKSLKGLRDSKNLLKYQSCKISFNLGHNILEIYNVLIQIRLTTSKTKRDI